MADSPPAEVRDRIRELRRVPASELLKNPANWRRHPKAQQAALLSVLEDVGYADALLARELDDGSLLLIDGHLRADTTPDQVVPVLVLDVDEAEGKRLLRSIDPIASMAETDKDALEALLAEAGAGSAELEKHLVTFYAGEKEKNTVGPGESTEDNDVDPDAMIAKWGVDRGQLWTAGRHRILCGDSFEADDLAELTGGSKAAMMLTDPPYAIYGSSTGVASSTADDKMVRPFFASLFRMARERVATFGHIYVHCDWRSWAAIWEGARQAGVTPRNLIVWDKGRFGLGANYFNCHEFVGFFALIPERMTMTGKTRSGQRQVPRPNVFTCSRPTGEDRLHNAAKPVELLEELIRNSSDDGAVVLDPFLGSGSTIVAAEKLGRIGWGVDLEPRWVAVTLERLAGLGLEPKRED